MARDAAGAEWGRYFRDKRRLGRTARLRRKKLPAIYLAYRVCTDLKWFGRFQHEIKVGRTSRSPQLRIDSFRADGFKLFAYWPLSGRNLELIESLLLADLRREFGSPSRGREFFLVPNVENAYTFLAGALADKGVIWEESD